MVRLGGEGREDTEATTRSILGSARIRADKQSDRDERYTTHTHIRNGDTMANHARTIVRGFDDPRDPLVPIAETAGTIASTIDETRAREEGAVSLDSNKFTLVFILNPESARFAATSAADGVSGGVDGAPLPSSPIARRATRTFKKPRTAEELSRRMPVSPTNNSAARVAARGLDDDVDISDLHVCRRATPLALTEQSKAEKKRGRMCRADGCENYIVHKGLCCRHGVRPGVCARELSGSASGSYHCVRALGRQEMFGRGVQHQRKAPGVVLETR